MNVHAILHGTHANGPGMRSVVWLRGCALGCVGCINRATWDFSGGTGYTPDQLAHEVFRHCLPGTEGITISGGEPMHQAGQLVEFLQAIHARRPDWSAGLFTGYSTEELAEGSYDLRDGSPFHYHGWMTPQEVRRTLVGCLYPRLDFIVAGRYDRNAGPGTEPLCSTANQRLILPTGRYQAADFREKVMEFNIEADGMCVITGFPL